jgi:hypothetical protein
LLNAGVGNPTADGGVAKPRGSRTHHIISLTLEEDDGVVGKWLRESYGGLSQAKAGVFLPGRAGSNTVGAIHVGNHANYTEAMRLELLEVIDPRDPNATRKAVDRLVNRARGALLAADGENINKPGIKEWRERIQRATPVTLEQYAEASRQGNDALRRLAQPGRGRGGGLGRLARRGVRGLSSGGAMPGRDLVIDTSDVPELSPPRNDWNGDRGLGEMAFFGVNLLSGPRGWIAAGVQVLSCVRSQACWDVGTAVMAGGALSPGHQGWGRFRTLPDSWRPLSQ